MEFGVGELGLDRLKVFLMAPADEQDAVMGDNRAGNGQNFGRRLPGAEDDFGEPATTHTIGINACKT